MCINNYLQSFRTWLSKGSRAQWLTFVLFVMILFLKSVSFHWFAFHSILISSLWRAPIVFASFYVAELLFPLFIGSFIFLTKRWWWTIVANIIVDIWCLANLIYYRTYDLFLSLDVISLVNNMGGAWSSILAYIEWSLLIFPLLTGFMALWVVCIRYSSHRQPKSFIFCLCGTIGLTLLNNYIIYKDYYSPNCTPEMRALNAIGVEDDNATNAGKYYPYYCPFSIVYANTQGICNSKNGGPHWAKHYIGEQSILSYLPAVCIYDIFSPNIVGEIISLSESELAEIEPFITKDSNPTPQRGLILILVESLENWPLEKDIDSVNAAPNLRTFLNNQHILYCDKIKSQTLKGNSGDGQMIVNSGLLPIADGVACIHYGDNTYPNLGHFYQSSTMINPWPKIWNQDEMCEKYGYKREIEFSGKDDQVADSAKAYLDTVPALSMSMIITVSTHAPFETPKEYNRPSFTSKTPDVLANYLSTLHFADSCIGAILHKIQENKTLSQNVIVITGDHIIFQPTVLDKFTSFGKEQNLSIASGDNYCPLIIYSPSIEGNIQVTDTCYQMDIYPTILHLIGCEDYYWKGFGVNLLDSAARHNRPITEQEAYRLSDLMIRSNYFEQYKP